MRTDLDSQSILVEIMSFMVNGDGCGVNPSATRRYAATSAVLLSTTRHSSTGWASMAGNQ